MRERFFSPLSKRRSPYGKSEGKGVRVHRKRKGRNGEFLGAAGEHGERDVLQGGRRQGRSLFEGVRRAVRRAGASRRISRRRQRAGCGIRAQTSKPHVCFMGHFDTVFPRGTTAKRPFRIEEGKAYGPGVLDMKSGVTIQLFAARALMEAGYSDRLIRIVLAGDEESMHPKSDMPRVFEEESRGAVAAFNFETGDVNNSLVVGRKGTIAYDVVVEGVSVHAGREPQKGRSAILEMAHKIVDIQALTDYEKGITFNVGTVKGGVVRNAVPDFAEIGVERPRDGKRTSRFRRGADQERAEKNLRGGHKDDVRPHDRNAPHVQNRRERQVVRFRERRLRRAGIREPGGCRLRRRFRLRLPRSPREFRRSTRWAERANGIIPTESMPSSRVSSNGRV